MAGTDILFTPLRVGTLELANRVVMSPMDGTNVIEGLVGCKYNGKVHDYYIERARDGVGLLIPGMAPLRTLARDQWLYDHPEIFREVGKLMDEIHQYDSKFFMQLGTGWGRSFTMMPVMGKLVEKPWLGRLMKGMINMDHLLVSADEGIPNVFMPQYKCRGLTRGEIHEYIDAYAKTAKMCRDAGCDGVEVHAVHEGYLLDQFAVKYMNHRTDEYGGSFENRYRFAVEIVQAIKESCGRDYPVSLRYSVLSKTRGFNEGAVPGEEYTEVGRDMEESERAIKYMEDAGYDMFNCDNGTYDAWYWSHPPVYMPMNCNLGDVEHIKQFTDRPVFCAGRMQPEAAAEAIEEGKLDGVTIGRQFLTDDHYLVKVREGRKEDIRPCIACHTACMPVACWKGSGVQVNIRELMDYHACALNPRTFDEKKYAVVPSKAPKRVAVIGGGIGGMEAALQLSKRGHTVALYEKTGELGGLFRAAAAPVFKEKDRELIEWYKRELAKSDVTVHMNTAVSDLKDVPADEYIIATGETPRRLPVSGAENTVRVEDVLLGKEEVGDKVVIIGGGLSGCECAYDLSLKGKHPVIVEMAEDLIKDMNVSAPNSMCMRELIRYRSIPVYLRARVTRINKNCVELDMDGKHETVEADSVVCAAGFSSGTSLVTGKRPPKNVHVIGDADKVSNLKHGIWMANDIAISM